MKGKYIAIGILVVAFAMTIGVVAVQADAPAGWSHSDWIYDKLRHRTWLTLQYVKDNNLMLGNIQIVLGNTFAYVDDVRNKLGTHGDNYDIMPVPTVFAYLGEILEELNDGTYGLPEIKKEVGDIYDELVTDFASKTSGGWGDVSDALIDVKAEIVDIWTLDGNKHGWDDLPAALDSIKFEVKDIRDVLGDPTKGPFHWPTFADALIDIKLEVEWTKITVGLIKTEVEAIEGKLDDIVIPEIRAIEEKIDDVVLPEIRAIEEKLDDIVIPEIRAIEAKLDGIVIPNQNEIKELLGQGLVGEVSHDGNWPDGTMTSGDGWVGDIGYVYLPHPEGHPKKYSLWVDLSDMSDVTTMTFTLYYDSSGGGGAEKIGAWVWGGGIAVDNVIITSAMKLNWGSGYLIVDQLPVAYDHLYVTVTQTGGLPFHLYWHYILEEN